MKVDNKIIKKKITNYIPQTNLYSLILHDVLKDISFLSINRQGKLSWRFKTYTDIQLID